MNEPVAKLPSWLRSPAWGAAAVVLVSACASTDAPKEQMAVAQAAVERATGSNAAEAPVELASARDKMARAQIAYANKDYVQARQLAQEAEAEANLAEAQARSVRANRALAEVRESIRALRAEMARAPS